MFITRLLEFSFTKKDAWHQECDFFSGQKGMQTKGQELVGGLGMMMHPID